MGRRNARGDRRGAAGAQCAECHEQAEHQQQRQWNQQGEAEQRDQCQQAAAAQDQPAGVAAIDPAAAQTHGGQAGQPTAQVEHADVFAGEAEIELEECGKVRHQQEVAEHLQCDKRQCPQAQR